MKEYTTHIVEFFNHKNADGTLTDLKLYVNQWVWPDGEIDSFELYDYHTKTVANLDGDEVVTSTNIDQVTLLQLKERAICEIINHEFEDNRYLDFDLGGRFE